MAAVAATTIGPVAGVRAGRAAGSVLLLVVLAASLAGFLLPHAEVARGMGEDAGLVRLLRAMAAMKAMFAAGLVGATLWRLQAPVSGGRLLAYAVACGAMAAGPGLIWGLAHIRLGAALLHGGLLAGVLLLWRDPAAARLLALAVARRRHGLASRSVSGVSGGPG